MNSGSISVTGPGITGAQDEACNPTRKLVVNWVLPGTSLAGGIKSNRLIAEAMVRLGHTVNIAYVALPRPWPKMWHVRRWLRRAKSEWDTRNHNSHHLERSTANLIPVNARRIEPEHLPDADVTIATWWETREWIEEWPTSKGIKAYFIRAHELHGGDPARVARTYRMPGLKFVIARWLKNLMAEKYGDSSAVLVPNGVDRSQFESESRDRAVVPTVGMLYGVATLKGAATAFNALRRLKDQFPELRAIAFGSQLPMPEHEPPIWLEYHLRPSQAEIPRLYQQADCWIVPSTTEGFGMPGIEAAACHCPIVSTRCGGPEDYVDDGVSGFLVPIGDAGAISDAVGRVLNLSGEKWRAMSQASYEISKRFDWDRSAGILQNELLRALERR
ncbi:glycosyltransferase family 4 protein [Sulfuritalea sp.]|uniref:glycosyltransferase family 4 protein n=1 Tax=Sulfuritalea sp. TaxID=2480090 RepID=UPI001AC251D5|nr:glycosyltransferase family 4 protein [Sulfuritalea sp.]MBN8474881.1 glycosyltransferase family 4 protein [Sulfuritalea sp.]